MKISLDFAKDLCPDLRIVNRKDLGKRACAHLMRDGEMCSKSNHFVCELVLFKQRSKAKTERNKEEAISASRINLLDTCPRKYHLLREKYIKPPGGDPPYLRAGNAFTVARAKIDLGHPFDLNDLRRDLTAIDRAKLRAILRFYQDYPPYPVGSVTCEDSCQFEFEGAWFIGYADAVTKDGKEIREWKYAVGAVSELQVARQAAVYLKGFPSAERFVVYRMKKPSYRPKKSETMREYEDRIFDALDADPSSAISKMTIERGSIDVDGILREMAATFTKVLPILHRAGMPPHYGSCDRCDFAMICASHMGASTSDIVRIMTARSETP